MVSCMEKTFHDFAVLIEVAEWHPVWKRPFMMLLF